MNYLEALTKSKKVALPKKEIVIPKFTEKCIGCSVSIEKAGICKTCVKRGVAIGKCEFCKGGNKLTVIGCCYDCLEEEDEGCPACGGTDRMIDGACLECWKETCREARMNGWD